MKSGADADPLDDLVVAAFQPATVLYRRATAAAKIARERAREYASSGRIERRARELDAAIETIVLGQAACEGWIYQAYRTAGVEPGAGGGWVQRWIEAPNRIADRNRPHHQPPLRGLDEHTVASLRHLSRWRNFLLHGDDRSRARLAEIISAGTESKHLNADIAAMIIASIDDAFTDAGSLLGAFGSPGLHSDFLWHSPDE